MYRNLLLEQPEPGIWLLTLNRPRSLNALDSRTLDEVGAAARAVAGEADARVLLVAGAGAKAFAAGADIAEMEGFTAVEGHAFSQRGMDAFGALEAVPVPVIAVVHGYCLGGGCELATSCDWILAGAGAVFGQPEVKLGLTPGFGATQRLARRIGAARALELITTARQVDAEEALRMGLVNHVYPDDGLREAAFAMARDIARRGPVAVRLAKQAVLRGRDADVAAGCALESEAFGLCFATADRAEGMRAFAERREPQWRNR